MKLNKELLMEGDSIEANALILAAMDRYRYNVNPETNSLVVDVPAGKLTLKDDIFDIDDETVKLFEDIDLDSYRETVKKLMENLKSE